MIACAPMGDINASIPTPQPVHYRMMFGALGTARHHSRLTFLSQASVENGVAQRLNLQSQTAVVKGCRTVQKADMVHNSLQPNITVDAQTYEVRVDGELITSEPADVLPMAQPWMIYCQKLLPQYAKPVNVSSRCVILMCNYWAVFVCMKEKLQKCVPVKVKP